VLLSTIGSRGDVQSLVALAVQLRAEDDGVKRADAIGAALTRASTSAG
jgi:hypothetical protein